MGPFHRLASGATYYGNSAENRKHNVELAMSRLDGALVPPGGTFSFNKVVGAQTVANGYKEGYAIALVGGTGPGTGQVKTISSVAGGICQVSTTLFHAVFRAGLAIEERNWHLYWIASYGGPPSGLQGLDATVYDDIGLDFQFVNNTGGWLAIETVANGEYARIALYGKDLGWQVIIDEPVITNVRKADPMPVIEKTHTLPPGQEVRVETATDGFDSAIRRRVLDGNGKMLLDTVFKSSYLPSRNVTMLGVPPNEPLD
jgi:vancomycin resistance protein YoaR